MGRADQGEKEARCKRTYGRSKIGGLRVQAQQARTQPRRASVASEVNIVHNRQQEVVLEDTDAHIHGVACAVGTGESEYRFTTCDALRIVGSAEPILRVETAFEEFILKTSSDIGFC